MAVEPERARARAPRPPRMVAEPVSNASLVTRSPKSCGGRARRRPRLATARIVPPLPRWMCMPRCDFSSSRAQALPDCHRVAWAGASCSSHAAVQRQQLARCRSRSAALEHYGQNFQAGTTDRFRPDRRGRQRVPPGLGRDNIAARTCVDVHSLSVLAACPVSRVGPRTGSSRAVFFFTINGVAVPAIVKALDTPASRFAAWRHAALPCCNASHRAALACPWYL